MPENINNILNYQVGAIVSKEVVKSEAGNVTLFAFDQGQGLSEHTAPYDALVIVTDGRAEVTLAGVKHELNKDDMLKLPAGSPHALFAVERFKMILVMIKGTN